MNQTCPICQSYLQFISHPRNSCDTNRYLKCSCGFTKDAPPRRTKMITLNDWITSSGKYPERAKSPELTDTVKANAETLLAKLNKMLDDLGVKNPKVSSGFRPSSVNSKISNAAKKSAHMSGRACDVADPDGKIGKLVRKNQKENKILETNGLMMESLESTPGWMHCDTIERFYRISMEFKP